MMNLCGIDEIITQGNYSFYDGCQLGDCPYDEGSEEHDAWVEGWNQSQSTQEMADEYE
jgi:hypothetical protein